MIDLDQLDGVDAETRVRFVSDLHLGNPDARLTTREDFISLITGCDILVVCGDFIENRPCLYQPAALELRLLFEEVCRELNVRLIVIAGNHDPGEEEYVASMDHGKIIAFHGHQLFKSTAPWSREYLYHKRQAREVICQYPEADTNLEQCAARARAMSLFVPPVLRKRLRNTSGVRGLVDLLRNACWPPTRPWRIVLSWVVMRRRAHQFIQQYFPQAKTVIFGHMHRTDVHQSRDCQYINTGAFFKHAHAIVVDVYQGRITLTHHY